MTGDGDFEAFYTATYDRLVGQLLVVVGSLEEAEDVVQEAFVRACGRWSHVRDYEVPEAWVRRVALNLASSGVRRARRRAALLVRLGPAADVPALSVDAVALTRTLRKLPLRGREALVLHHVVGLSVQEIAGELGVPVGTVTARLSRARARLARLLAAEGEEIGHAHG
ncbi:MAG TPA: sigma-70 family RNA polymerase sigma factor [Actinomycetes bacterium]|nr:sigma-70 family RNA polymerase sigma factor [Actinomycetes bacterium]